MVSKIVYSGFVEFSAQVCRFADSIILIIFYLSSKEKILILNSCFIYIMELVVEYVQPIVWQTRAFSYVQNRVTCSSYPL